MKRIALAGNPNCGKTTMFNALTGSNQYVGNWPGVTVEKKEGKLKGNKDVTIVDLPGIYSLSPYSLDEVVARNFLVEDMPDGIINIIDATNLERNLYLTTQLLELGIPVVIALNMMDLVKERGDKIDTKRLSKELGCVIVEVSALKNQGLSVLIEEAVKEVNTQTSSAILSMFDGVLKESVDAAEAIIAQNHDAKTTHWYAIKYLENDEKIMEKSKLSSDQLNEITQIRETLEHKLDDDCESIVTNARYEYITEMIKHCYHKTMTGMSTSDKIDCIVTNRWLALPVFAAIMILVYYVSVSTLGTIVTDWVNGTLVEETIQPLVGDFLTNVGAAEWLNSLVVDGIIGGLGAPLGFVPQMAILFLFLSILEDCGYMARVAFIMDRAFRRFGLSGKSFIPLMISSGCGVPGIMATKTIESEKDRRMTIMTTTFIPCGAKLPVIALIAGALMGGSWWMTPLMYFVGIAAVVISAIILKKTSMFAGDPSPFVMELPSYHFPSAKGVLLHVWERVWSFIKKAGTILFLCCAVMWFLGSFGFEDGAFGMVGEESSLLAMIGGFIAPIFEPLGFGNWRAVAASLSGFVAKEGIVSTIGVVLGLGDAGETDPTLWAAVMAMFPTGMAAFSFLLFNMLDSPCLAALSTVAKEMNSKKWTWFTIGFQTVFAYTITFMVYQLGSWIAYGTFGSATIVALLVLAVYIYLLFRPTPEKRAFKMAKKAMNEG